jgi:hypothetical protein
MRGGREGFACRRRDKRPRIVDEAGPAHSTQASEPREATPAEEPCDDQESTSIRETVQADEEVSQRRQAAFKSVRSDRKCRPLPALRDLREYEEQDTNGQWTPSVTRTSFSKRFRQGVQRWMEGDGGRDFTALHVAHLDQDQRRQHPDDKIRTTGSAVRRRL